MRQVFYINTTTILTTLLTAILSYFASFFFFFFFSLQHFENYHNLSPGECAMYLNGIPIDIEVYDVYTLLDTMKSEAAVMEGLFSLGVKVSILLLSLMLDIVYNWIDKQLFNCYLNDKQFD